MPPTRTATVVLDANITPYSAKMTRAAAIGATTGKSIDASMTRAGAGAQKLGTATGLLSGKFGALSAVGGAAFAGVGLAAGYAVKTFMDFDVAMDGVAASTGASAAELDKLGQTAIDAAKETKFGAIDAAAGIEALGKAGVETADIVSGGLKGALDLAAAGEVEVADAAELAAGAMTQFKLEGEDVPHIADLMAAAAGKAQGSVGDMAFAFKQSGLVAAQMGLSIEETTGTLAAFASNALIGSDAGTSFRTMLLRLANPSGEARDIMQDLGLAAYDASGNFVGMADFAGQLHDKLGPLAQAERDAALATIFGSDAIRAANVLYQEGAEGIESWTGKVDDAGFASEQAARRTDNLRGDLERLGGEIEALGITLGGTADGPMRDFVQGLEDVFASINEEAELWQEKYIPAVKDAGDWINEHLIPDFLGLNDVIGRDREEIEAATRSTERASEVFETHAENLAGYTAAQEGATAAQEDATGVTEAQAEANEQLASEMEKVRQEAVDSGNAFLDTRDANRDWLQSIDDATASLEENGATLDLNTQAGRDNEEALDAMGDAALVMLQDMIDSGKGTDEAQAQMRETLIKTYLQFDNNIGRAEDYADSILGIPASAVTTPVFADAQARQKVAAFKLLLAGIDETVGVRVNVSTDTGGLGGFFTAGSTRPGGMPWLGSYPRTQGPHDGGAIDYGVPSGTPLRATFPGFLDVTDLGNRSYGKYYVLRGGGKYELAAHLSSFARGDGFVSTGTFIGRSGSTGRSTGPHVHLLRNFHTGGWTSGGPINTAPGEYVVHAQAAAANQGLIEAINRGSRPALGAVRWHPDDVRALGKVIAGEMVAAIGASSYVAAGRGSLYSRGG